MILAGNPEVVESCSGGALSLSRDGSAGGGVVVVVGVKLDSRSKELLTWSLVKVAQSGDRVIALHILDPNADKRSLISLVKTFDSVLAAYEGFCNLKQVDLKMKVCRGSPVRKILSREAKSCGATSLIVGTSGVHHTIRSRISVAKYCAKNLEKNVLVVCADNGKIVFRRDPITSDVPHFGGSYVSESRSKNRKILSKSSLNSKPSRFLSTSSGNEGISMALVPIKTHGVLESTSGWALLRRIFLHRQRMSEASSTSTKKSSVLHWLLKLPGRHSVAAIYPDQKQINASYTVDCHLKLNQEKDAIVMTDDADSATYSNIFSVELKDLGEKFSTMCRTFSYQELFAATNSFAPENLIGKGGSSQVYRGCLQGGKELAVKVLKSSNDSLERFVSEIEIVTSLHHNNIISLVGFCFEEDRLLLVYDLLSRGSLEDNLHGSQNSGKLFGWGERYKVALGVSEALGHLHNAAESIIHRDVKSSNILLSNDFEPQLADFGLATWASRSSHHVSTSDVNGTFGYLAPEYLMHGKMNEKVDVYAFGVVLLELLSGRKPIDDGHRKGEESLVMWARHILKKGEISALLDPDLTSEYDHDQFEKLVLAAILCIRHAPQSRPEISLLLKLLQGAPEVIEWARLEINSSDDISCITGEEPTNIQSFLNLALLNLDDDSASVSSTEQNISVEDYLGGRWSRSSSFE